MGTNCTTIAVITSGLVLSALAPLAFHLQLAQALTEATSSTSTIQFDAPAASTTASSTLEISALAPPEAATTEPTLKGLAAARVVGTKFIDYCTDGTKLTAIPGDPAIDANLSKPDAPTPKCPDGLTWDHTSGMDEYDTASGNLDPGLYAQQADGSFIVHYAASTYADATSTSDWPDRVVILKASPVAATVETAPDAATTVQADAPTTSDASSSAASTQ